MAASNATELLNDQINVTDLVTCDQLNDTCSDCLSSDKCTWVQTNGSSIGQYCVQRLGWAADLISNQTGIENLDECHDPPAYSNYLKIAAIVFAIAFVTVIILVFIIQKLRPICARRADAAANSKDKDVQQPMVTLDTTT